MMTPEQIEKEFIWVEAWWPGIKGSWPRIRIDEVDEKVRVPSGNLGCCISIQQRGSQELDESAPWIGDFYIDIDCKNNLPKALEDTKKVVKYLRDQCLGADYPRIWFSGGKGFHVGVPHQILEIEPSVTLHETFRTAADIVVDETGVDSVDPALYSTRRQLRLPNSIHPKSKLFKHELDPNRFLSMEIDEILELAKTESNYQPQYDPAPTEGGRLWWTQVLATYVGKKARQGTHAPTATSAVEAPEGNPPCIEHLLKNPPPEGVRNKATMNFVSFFKDKGISKAEVEIMAEQWCRDLYQGPADQLGAVVASVKKVVNSVYKGDYTWQCSYMWGEFKDDPSFSCNSATCPWVSDIINITKIPLDRDRADKAWEYIITKDKDRFFEMSGQLVVRVGNRQHVQFVAIDNDGRGRRLLAAHMPDHVSFVKDEKVENEGDEPEQKVVNPPKATLEAMCAKPPLQKLKPIKKVARAPYVTAKGELVGKQGYHPEAQVWYTGEVGEITPIMERETCLEIIRDAYIDFPVKREHYPRLLMFVFALVLSEAINGPSPLFNFSSGPPNVGKTKIAKHSFTLMGVRFVVLAFSKDEEVLKKAVATAMRAHPVAILFDNVVGTIGGGWFEAMLTAESTSIRLLGGNTFIEVPGSLIKAMTSNSPKSTRDAAHRTVEIFILDVPGRTANDFRHYDIKAYQRQAGAQFRNAVFGLIMQWVEAGMPSATRITNDKFYEFESLLGGLLEYHGIKYDLITEPQKQSVEEMEAKWEQWAESMQGRGWFRAADLLLDGEVPEEFWFISRSKVGLGRALSKRADDGQGRLRLLKREDSNKVKEFCVAGDAGDKNAKNLSPAGHPSVDIPAFSGDTGDKNLHPEKKNQSGNLHPPVNYMAEWESSPASPGKPAQMLVAQWSGISRRTQEAIPGSDLSPADVACLFWRHFGPGIDISEHAAVERLQVSYRLIRDSARGRLPGGFTLRSREADAAMPFMTYRIFNHALETSDLSGLSEEDLLVLLEHELVSESEPDEDGEITLLVTQ